MACTREVPEVETDCDGPDLEGVVSDKVYRDITEVPFLLPWARGSYCQALEKCTQEDVRQCILEACG